MCAEQMGRCSYRAAHLHTTLPHAFDACGAAIRGLEGVKGRIDASIPIWGLCYLPADACFTVLVSCCPGYETLKTTPGLTAGHCGAYAYLIPILALHEELSLPKIVPIGIQSNTNEGNRLSVLIRAAKGSREGWTTMNRRQGDASVLKHGSVPCWKKITSPMGSPKKSLGRDTIM